MDPNEAYTKRLAQLKGKSAKQCEWCRHWYMANDTRTDSGLCLNCVARGAKPTIEAYKRNNNKYFLTDKDRQKIANTRTVRIGPFFKSNV